MCSSSAEKAAWNGTEGPEQVTGTSLPLRQKQRRCNNIRRVEEREQRPQLFLEMDVQVYQLQLQVS